SRPRIARVLSTCQTVATLISLLLAASPSVDSSTIQFLSGGNAMPNPRLVIRAFGLLSLLLVTFLCAPVGFTQDGEGASTSPFAGLRFREIGPASPAGRI